MPKIKVTLNKTNTAKLERLYRYLKEHWKLFDDEFKQMFTDHIKEEIKSLKDCSEKNIVEFYITEAKSMLPSMETKEYYDIFPNITKTVRANLARKYTQNLNFNNSIDIYFNDVKREYINHPMNESDSLEFCEENRDIFLKNNLKLVIECAKRYRGLGLPFEDLIQIGNVGLLTAFEHYDTKRNKLQNAIVDSIKESNLEKFTRDDAESIIRMNFKYGKNLEKTLNAIPEYGFQNKDLFIAWTRKTIKNAVFASIAFHWIRAYILLELSRYSNVIRIPKGANDEENNDENSMKGTPILRLDSINPHTDDCYHDNQIAGIANEEFIIEDNYIDNMEKQNMFSTIINKALYSLDSLSARVIKKRFGITFPYQLTVNEIAESEGLSTSKVKYIINSSLTIIASSISESDKQIIMEMLG